MDKDQQDSASLSRFERSMNMEILVVILSLVITVPLLLLGIWKAYELCVTLLG